MMRRKDVGRNVSFLIQNSEQFRPGFDLIKSLNKHFYYFEFADETESRFDSLLISSSCFEAYYLKIFISPSNFPYSNIALW